MMDSTIEYELLKLSVHAVSFLTDNEKISLIASLWNETIDCKNCPFRTECENDKDQDSCDDYIERKLLNA